MSSRAHGGVVRIRVLQDGTMDIGVEGDLSVMETVYACQQLLVNLIVRPPSSPSGIEGFRPRRVP